MYVHRFHEFYFHRLTVYNVQPLIQQFMQYKIVCVKCQFPAMYIYWVSLDNLGDVSTIFPVGGHCLNITQQMRHIVALVIQVV